MTHPKGAVNTGSKEPDTKVKMVEGGKKSPRISPEQAEKIAQGVREALQLKISDIQTGKIIISFGVGRVYEAIGALSDDKIVSNQLQEIVNRASNQFCEERGVVEQNYPNITLVDSRNRKAPSVVATTDSGEMKPIQKKGA